jgi:ATP-dependent helicase/nuclease subunit A
MAERTYTDEQLSAINTRDKTLLVSAAAGSGKTAVLTERIIRTLLDESSDVLISDMLIVTFTNAATSEMRERIASTIRERLRLFPENERLERQLNLLPLAKISTIDSFCNEIVRENAERFGISPKYRIADSSEAHLLAHGIWSRLIEEAYQGELPDVATAEEFETLADSLTGVKNTSELESVFALLYERSRSSEDGARIFSRLAEEMSGYTFENNPYIDYAMDSLKTVLAHYKPAFEKLMSSYGRFREDGAPGDIYTTSLKNILDTIADLEETDFYPTLMLILYGAAPTRRFHALGDSKGSILTAGVYKNFKSAIERLYERYFIYPSQEWTHTLEYLSRQLKILARFMERFDEVFLAAKTERGILEHADVERLALESLVGEDGLPTELAEYYRKRFSAIYIDEFQDINETQGKIFSAIARENNLFMVGDVKQSIYGFRSARPEIFERMKNAFPPIESSEGSPSATVFMSKNFRCDRPVIDFVNKIFDTAFDLTQKSMAYTEGDRLSYAKLFDGGEPEYRDVRLQLFPKETVTSHTPLGRAREIQPVWTALQIWKLVGKETLNSGKKISPSDIAIIMRKDQGRAEDYAAALELFGIPASYPKKKSFLSKPEIQLILALLNTIDNPERDIYLAGAMLSPIFSFTADELYTVRQADRDSSLWRSLIAYSQNNPEDTHARTFIETVRKYRAIAENERIDTFLGRLYTDLHILSLAGGEGKTDSLMALLGAARSLAASSYEGLHAFISYVNALLEEDKDLIEEKEGSLEDAVKIMTVHKSKGLEFPVVFLVDATVDLVSTMDKRGSIAYSDKYGMAMRERMPGGPVLFANPVYNVIIDSNLDRAVEEEMRVYYVALTRARERLTILGATNKSRTAYEEEMQSLSFVKSPQLLREVKSFMDVIFISGLGSEVSWKFNGQEIAANSSKIKFSQETLDEQAKLLTVIAKREHLDVNETLQKYLPDYDRSALFIEQHISDGEEITSKSEGLYEAIMERLTYRYPSEHLTTLPEKMSVSRLSPSLLDEEDGEERLTIDGVPAESEKKLGRMPEFIRPDKISESKKRGIATHNFMQFFDVASLISHGAEAELERLVENRFISKKNSLLVRLSEIELFKTSKLLSEMKAAKNLYRELRFSVMLPASLFTENPERRELYRDSELLLQGVIDCIIEDAEGNLHLIDYKTDRLSREELCDRSLAEAKLRESHSRQLNYYALAIEKIFGRRPKTVRVYSLMLGDCVDV